MRFSVMSDRTYFCRLFFSQRNLDSFGEIDDRYLWFKNKVFKIYIQYFLEIVIIEIFVV